MGGWTSFDKAWFAPALASWLTAGLVGFIEHTFAIDLPSSVEGYILVALTSGVVYLIPNKPKAAPAAPVAPAA